MRIALQGLRASLVIGILGLHASAVRAQVPAWQVLTPFGQTSGTTSSVSATVADGAGNVYVAGSFTDTVSFGSLSLTSTGRNDGFVAKWSQTAGRFEWAQLIGGANNESVTALALSGTTVYLAGSTNSPTASLGALDLTAEINGDAFVARLTDAGSSSSFAWVNGIGGSGHDRVNSLAVNGASIYLAGTFASPSLSLGSSVFTNASNSGNTDMFVAKLLDAGASASTVWARQVSGPMDETPTALALNGSSLYLSGYFAGTAASFGTISLTNTSAATNAATSDLFVAKLTDAGSTGSFTWALGAGGALYEQASGLAVNGSNVYVTGRFNSPSISLGSSALTNASPSFDAFVTKLTDAGSSGRFTWALRAGGTGHEAPEALVAAGNQLYVAGSFYGSQTSTFGATTLTNNDSNLRTQDLFVTKLLDAGSTGSFAWALGAGGSSDDYAHALAIGGTRLWVTGSITPSVSFGPLSATTPSGVSTGFLAAFEDLALPTRRPVWESQLAVYPNPARTSLNVRLPAGTSAATLELSDALGRQLHTAPITAAAGSTTQLQLPPLPPGMYWLTLRIAGQQVSRPLAIE